MTDRHAGYIVTLAEDVREDDAEDILTALRMVRGVLSVEPIVGSFEEHIAEQRADTRWRERLLELVDSGPDRDR